MKTKIILGITIALTTALYFGCKKDIKNQTSTSPVSANTENLKCPNAGGGHWYYLCQWDVKLSRPKQF